MSFRLETKIEPTMTRRRVSERVCEKLTGIGGTLLVRGATPREVRKDARRD